MDTRNDYEISQGAFVGSVHYDIETFREFPEKLEAKAAELKDKTVVMYCTGGIRCEKFAPYLKQLGFQEVYQLDGGILKYLEEVPADQDLWEGECFVFDERTSVDNNLAKGSGPDHSQRHANARKPKYKVPE